jgi:NAD(P)-dependent dehydrogenase (short-subunit alcohol dehydrogenase family)
MSHRLQNKIAIVTGSSSGNGRAIALALSAAGATIVCADLDKKARKEGYEKDLEIDTDDVIRKQGAKACYVQTDVRRAPEVENLVARTVSDFGRLDIMVNNAGVGAGLHTIVDETEEQYDLVMAVNAKGVWHCCKYAITQMLKQEPLETGSRGKVVNIASVAALIGGGRHPAYSASKAAVVNLTRQLAVTFGPQRINVNAVCPGLIPTAMTRPASPEDEEWHKGTLQYTPWPRLGTSQDVAHCVLFLSSPESEWITGVALPKPRTHVLNSMQRQFGADKPRL